MITVKQNAYIKKASQLKTYSKIHEQILFVLLNEKKYFTKDELLCFSNQNQLLLDSVLIDLEKSKTVIIEGWLIRIKDFEDFNKEICEELLKDIIIQ